MSYTLIGMGYSSIDLFEQKWAIAQQYLEKEKIDSLPTIIAEMEGLVDEKQTLKQAKIAYLLGEYWHYQEKWQKGIKYLEKAIAGLKQDSTTQLLLAESYLVSGYCWHELEDFEATLFSYQQALALKQKVLGKHHLKVSNLYFNIGYILQEKRDILASDQAFQRGVAILDTISDKKEEQFADFYEELGYNQILKGDFHSAINYLQKALAIKKKTFSPQSEQLIFAYKYLGISFKENGNAGKAIPYFRQALQITEKQSEKDNFEESMLNFHIGKAYLELEEYEKAYTWLEKAINTDIENTYLVPEINRLKGEVASKKGNILLADKYFDKAVLGFQNKVKNHQEYLLATYKSLINHHLNTGRYENALIYINKAISQGKIIYKQRPHEFFEFYKLKGIYFYYQGNKKAAKTYFSKAQNSIGGAINWRKANSLQLRNQVSLNEAYASLFLAPKADAISIQNLIQADSILSETVDLITYLTKNYREQSTKEIFIEQSYTIFKKAIDTKFALFQLTQNDKYIKAAFSFSEKSKNLILLETLKNVAAFESAEIPISIVEKENDLKTNITYLENKRFEENQQSKIDTLLRKELNRAIFTLKEKHTALVNKIEQNYPKYYELKFAQKSISIKNIQKGLVSDEQTIVEYFMSDSSIYVFLIKKNTFQTFTLPKAKNLENTIDQFRNSIYSYRPPTTNDSNKLNDSLIEVTNRLGLLLYQSLFEPFKTQLTTKITIIADGVLGYLPFDALVTANAQGNKTPNYLMVEHLISFAHSVNWLNELSDKRNPIFEQNFLGIAPIFKNIGNVDEIADFRLGLGPLKYNQAEVEKIKNSIGGKVIKGGSATRKQFLEHLQKGQILHLATHGKSNDQKGDYSYLAFAEPLSATDNQFLYVKDLFNLKIPADLVVLSACETGLGEIKRGEGIVGIGKGFSYAGAKSLVTTLWRVSDNSTANFMPIFYKNLKKGLAKDEALWKAKKEFIQKYRNVSHPFFWSGYVAYGNMTPIEFQHGLVCYLKLCLGPFSCFVIVAFLFYRNRRFFDV